MKRVLLILLIPILTFAIIAGLWVGVVNPKLEIWSKQKIEAYFEEKLPISVKIENISINLFYPSIKITNIIFIPKDAGLRKLIEQLTISSIETKVNAFKLLLGNADISAIIISKPIVKLNIDPILEDKSTPQELPVAKILQLINKLPVSKVVLSALELEITSQLYNFTSKVSKSHLSIEKANGSLLSKIDLPQLEIQNHLLEKLNFEIYGTLKIDNKNISLQEIKIIGPGIESKIFGQIINWKSVTTSPNIELQPQTEIDFKRMHDSFLPKQKLESLSGKASASLNIKFKNNKLYSEGEIRTKEIEVSGFQIGDARIMAELKEYDLHLSKVNIEHPSGSADLDNFQLNLKTPYKYSGSLNVKSLSIHELLKNIGVGEIPVWVNLNGNINCSGSIELIKNECEAKIFGDKLRVKTSMQNNQDLVFLDNFNASGKVSLNDKSVSYTTELHVGKSKGTSEGEISYSNGFNIIFSTPFIQFSDIKNLANLDLKGDLKLKGSTQGDSSAAVFTINLEGQNIVFEKYKLGNATTVLSYESGNMYFDKLSGAYKKTSYLGDLKLDLNKSMISGKFNLPTAELSDINEILNHLYTLPFAVVGTGDATISLDGPLDFWNLNHELHSKFKNVVVAGEKFDVLKFNTLGNNGTIDFKNTYLEKNKNSFLVSGSVLPGKKLNILAETTNFPLEQSDILGGITNSIFGKLTANLKVEGSIDNPIINSSLKVVDTVLEEQEIADSSVIFYADKQKIKSNFNFMGRKIRGSVLYPLADLQTPMQLQLKTDNLNFVSMLGLFTGASHLKDIESMLTAELDLNSSSGDIFKSSGSLYIPNLFIRRGNQYITHQSPLEVQFEKGFAKIKNFNLEGPGNIIKIQGEDFTSDNLNVRIKAEADLRFMHILAPFLENLGGPVNINTEITGSIFQPKIFGSADILNGYVKIKGFPHAFERIQSNIAFSQSKIVIGNLKSAIAGGTLNGNGSVLIKGLKDMPVLINARLENVKFNVPEKVRSSGSADITFSGNWFPFLLSGVYKVDGALVTKEFIETTGITNIKQSVYLPKILKENNFDPVLLDIQVLLEKDIVIKNSLADGGATGTLQIKGPPQNPGLIGKVEFIKNSKLTFKDKIFDIITGSAIFKTAEDINPELFISAQSRVADYDVSLLVQGEAKDPNFVLSSTPPLSEQDLISLLALGVTSSNLDKNVQSKDQQSQLGYEAGAALFSSNPLVKNFSETVGFNIKLTTSFDSTRNISIPKIVAEKKLTGKVKAIFGKTLDQNMSDVKIQYSIDNDWSTIGSWEERIPQESTDAGSGIKSTSSPSIFGLDLEYKKEFK